MTVRFTAEHAACGTVVADELPDGYPVEEGVGLWCPACRVSWWAAPVDEQPPPEEQGPAGDRPPPSIVRRLLRRD